MTHHLRPLRVVLTGGPGGGKTTAADLFRREIGKRVIIVPEAATLLFAGGFPRAQGPEAQRSTQQAIFAVQTHLEDVQAASYPDRVLLCDRGTVDGAGYWPEADGGADGFFDAVGSTLEDELSRYDIVLFFETAAVGGIDIESGNPQRIESLQEAIELDRRLRSFWSQHPNFHLVPHRPSFLDKIVESLGLLDLLVERHDPNGQGTPRPS